MNGFMSEINDKLNEIERKEQVKILHAVESGSRAWGFASPDSDYDVRFIYARKCKDYLRLDPQKDVIEWQLDEVFDMNGWDLRKALMQFYRGNATLFEWGNSPIVYRTTEEWEHIFKNVKPYFSVKAAAYHYYGTANSTYHQYLQDQQIRYKKYFYALRPLLACRYVQEYRCAPPVLFSELMKMDMPAELRCGIEELLEKKVITNESDLNPQIPAVQSFIASELLRQKVNADAAQDDGKKDWGRLNELFFDLVFN